MKKRIIAAAMVCVALAGCGERGFALDHNYEGSIPEGEDAECIISLNEDLKERSGRKAIKRVGIEDYGTAGELLEKAKAAGGKDYTEYMLLEGSVYDRSFFGNIFGMEGEQLKGSWLMAKEKDGEWEIAFEEGEAK